MFMNVIQGPSTASLKHAICVMSWTALPNIGDGQPAGTVQIGIKPDATLIFALTNTPVAEASMSQELATTTGPALIRVDEVCFPVGAIAHNHTHSGAGFRHLVQGTLRLEAQEHTQTVTTGESWFEPALSPVRAVALQTNGVTRFIRCMVVPPEYEGRSTFKLVDPADAKLPRLQMTHRHIDHPFLF